MQRAAGVCEITSSCLEPPSAMNGTNGACDRAALHGPRVAHDQGDTGDDREPQSVEALKLELKQAQAELAQRVREIARLRRQLGNEERSDGVVAFPEDANGPDALAPLGDASHSATYRRATVVHVAEDVRSQEYPTLQRAAVTYASSSLPPPNSRGSVPSQRQTPRRSCEVEVEFTEDMHFYAGLTQDISQGGVFIATYRLVPVGTHLKLAFDLPDGTHIQANGEVKWQRENATTSMRPGMGISFQDLDRDALTAIGQYCRERPPLYMDV
jgi:uncharacterized protein (TIGR02266 family)